MAEQRIKALSDIVTDAHTKIQQDFALIDPIVGVSHNMRKNGVPADVMTIDCLKTKKRIIIILHDQQLDTVHYQFSFIEQDPADEFNTLPFEKMTADIIYTWIKEYFSEV